MHLKYSVNLPLALPQLCLSTRDWTFLRYDHFYMTNTINSHKSRVSTFVSFRAPYFCKEHVNSFMSSNITWHFKRSTSTDLRWRIIKVLNPLAQSPLDDFRKIFTLKRVYTKYTRYNSIKQLQKLSLGLKSFLGAVTSMQINRIGKTDNVW